MALQPDAKALANPTKTFFVRMITRDISLEDCILDLIDNSVDGAWKCEGSKPVGLADGADLSRYSIEIAVSSDGFRITDNCGGMSLSAAVDHAFSFGRQATDTTDDYSIGVYGIGMKRAVFKLGEDIRVRSTYVDSDKRTISFVVPIKVNKWLEKDTPPWDFDIEDDEPLKEPGVEIVVESLTQGASTSFENPAFVQNLKRTIARDYSLHLARGLTISLNGDVIQGWKIELRQGDDFASMRVEYKDEAEGKHPTVSDAFARYVGGSPEMVELYLTGAKVGSILSEVVTSGVKVRPFGNPVIVPESLHDILASRIINAEDYRIVSFLTNRANRAFAQLMLEKKPDLLDRLHSYFTPLKDDLDAIFAARLSELSLLSDHPGIETIVEWASLSDLETAITRFDADIGGTG